MTSPSHDSISQVDAGWDDVAQPSGVATLPTSSTLPPELDALDDGWSAAAHEAPVASATPGSYAPVGSSHPTAIDALDDGWGEDDDSARALPRHSQRQVKPSSGASKKAKRKLTRDLKAQQIRTEHQRSQTKKESRRETDKRRREEADKQAAARRQELEARREAKNANGKQAKTKVPKQAKPKTTSPAPLAVVREADKTITVQSQETKPHLPSYVLWGIVIVALIAVGYWAARP